MLLYASSILQYSVSHSMSWCCTPFHSIVAYALLYAQALRPQALSSKPCAVSVRFAPGLKAQAVDDIRTVCYAMAVTRLEIAGTQAQHPKGKARFKV